MALVLCEGSTDKSRAVSKTGILRRRKAMLIGIYIVIAVAAIWIYGLMEARWLKCTHLQIGKVRNLTLAHISDLHYSGNKEYLKRIVELVNSGQPDFVCITGDFVSNAKWLDDGLKQLSAINAPIYAVTGNWDYWVRADLKKIADMCEQSGGRLLLDESIILEGEEVQITGAIGEKPTWIPEPSNGTDILLVHYPAFVEKLEAREFDLILAGHSHGGQVRLPWIGSVIVPYSVGKYDLGLYSTGCGPLYVTSGTGTSALPIRLGCRPEIVFIDL